MISILLCPLLLSVIPAQAQVLPREETLTITSGWSGAPYFNPMQGATSWGRGLMYPSMFMYSPYSDEWIPYAAKDWRWIDIYTLEIDLRDEAVWSDGRPITADDVKYTLELGKRYPVVWSYLWLYLEEVRVINPKKLQLVTTPSKLNYFQFLDILHTPVILPKHRFEKLEAEMGADIVSFGDPDPSQIITGGPYKLLRWDTTTSIVYQRVDDWWGKDLFGLPKPKYIVHYHPWSNPTMSLVFERGELDIATHFFVDVHKLWIEKGLARGTYLKDPPYYLGGDIMFLMIMWKKPLDNPALRRAIAHAIPVRRLIDEAQCGYSTPASPSLVRPGDIWAKWIDRSLVEKYGWEYNVDKAKQILDEAGITVGSDGIRRMPDGTKLSGFTIIVPNGWTDWMVMCQIISEELAKIGIGVTPEYPEAGLWAERINNGQYDFAIAWAGGGAGFAHPWATYRNLMDPRLGTNQWGGYGAPHYPKTEVIPYIDQIPKEFADPEKQKELYSKLQEIAMKDLPGVPLFHGPVWYEYSEEVWRGFPTKENGAWFANFYDGSWPDALPSLFYLYRKGETPVTPTWVNQLKFPTSRFVDSLAAAPPPTGEVIAGITETLPKIMKSLEDLGKAVDNLGGKLTGLASSSDIANLRSEVSALRADLATFNTLLMVQVVLSLIVLIAVIIVLVRKK